MQDTDLMTQSITDDQRQRAQRFANAHRKGDPVVLFNIWDAGSARAVAEAGAEAVATGSWSVAAAHGYSDGEQIPLDFALRIYERIVSAVDLPVTIDFEGGYSEHPDQVASNTGRLIDAGIVGINFEDQVLGRDSLHSIADQQRRISAIRTTARERGIGLFINARTDIFLQSTPDEHASRIEAALEREAAYREAGASGFFVPGLIDAGLIETMCEKSVLPVNVYMRDGVPPVGTLAQMGAARISYGPAPYRRTYAWLQEQAALVSSSARKR